MPERFPSLPSASMRCAAIALFDLDHTLLNASSSFTFGKYLYRRGFFSTPLMLSMAGLYALHRVGLVSIITLQEKIFQRLFQGKSQALFMHEAAQFLKAHLSEMLYQPAIRELRAAQAQGDFVAILSSAPDFLVGLIAQELGLDHWEGTAYSVDSSGNFSHISHFLLGDDKATYSYLCAESLHIDKSQVRAYTDSILDLPLMLSAGQKVAVQPDKRLKALSHQNHWRII